MLRLSCIGLFSTAPKLDNFCAKKTTFGSSFLSAKSWLRFWSHLLMQRDFSSNYMGGRRKRANKRCRAYTSLFSNMLKNFLKKRIICSHKISLFMFKNSVYFSASPFLAGAPSLRLLWQRHWVSLELT